MFDHDGDAEAGVLGHAIRIAHYLYPNAYLSSARALLLAPTPDSRLFINGRRNQRTRLRTLEIFQNEAPAHPSTAMAVSIHPASAAVLDFVRVDHKDVHKVVVVDGTDGDASPAVAR